MKLSRRPFLLMLLALLMVAVQHGALLHGFAHGWEPSQSELRDEGGVVGSAVCESCVAYAAVGASIPSAGDPPCLAYAPPLLPALLAVWPTAAASLPYRARAPPSSV